MSDGTIMVDAPALDPGQVQAEITPAETQGAAAEQPAVATEDADDEGDDGSTGEQSDHKKRNRPGKWQRQVERERIELELQRKKLELDRREFELTQRATQPATPQQTQAKSEQLPVAPNIFNYDTTSEEGLAAFNKANADYVRSLLNIEISSMQSRLQEQQEEQKRQSVLQEWRSAEAEYVKVNQNYVNDIRPMVKLASESTVISDALNRCPAELRPAITVHLSKNSEAIQRLTENRLDPVGVAMEVGAAMAEVRKSPQLSQNATTKPPSPTKTVNPAPLVASSAENDFLQWARQNRVI